VYRIGLAATGGKGGKYKRHRNAAYGEPVANEAGEMVAQAELYRLAKKVALRVFVALFSKTQYDFNLNQEMPLVDPFKYFADVSLDAVVLGLGEPEDLEEAELAFAVVEHVVIAT